MRLCFDIESDGLNYTKIWILATEDLDTGEKKFFTDYEDPQKSGGLIEGIAYLKQATMLMGHNIISFDLPALKKLHGFTTEAKLVDTLLLSQLGSFHRFRINGISYHKMEVWGKFLRDEKHEDPDWNNYSIQMRDRCTSDVSLNIKIFNYLMREVAKIKEVQPEYAKVIKLEHEVAIETAQQVENGWLLDQNLAKQTLKRIEVRMAEIELEIEPRLPPKVVKIDAQPRKPKVQKDGRYDKVTREWFKVERPADGVVPEEYQRLEKTPADLGNNDIVSEFLLSEGWIPTEWNWKKHPDGTWEKRGPKLTEESFESITGGYGKLVAEWRMLRSRVGLITGLLESVREDGRVACDPAVIGTHTGRMRHRGIVNIPSASVPWGKEIRQMFIAEKGMKLIGCDSAANQLRGLAHYLGDAEFTASAVEGTQELGTDVHTRNANILGISRRAAKPFFYALIFGAGAKKLGEAVGAGEAEGKKLQAKFFKGMPSYNQTLRRLAEMWEFYDGCVWGLDGRPVYGEKHKALNNLLQAFEAVTVKSAVILAIKRLKEAGIKHKLLIIYHDECEFEVEEGRVQEAADIVQQAFADAPKEYGVDFMSGDAKVGDNWYDIH